MQHRRPTGRAWLLLIGVALLASCTMPNRPGTSESGTSASSGVQDPPGSTAFAALVGLGSFWAEQQPLLYGVPLDPIAGTVDYRTSIGATLPRCDGAELAESTAAGNAFYCEQENTIAYDADLLSDLAHDYGDLAVQVLIAHEYGHAVQAQSGRAGRSVALELQADCFAGAWTAAGPDHGAAPADENSYRAVLHSLLDSADPPVGTAPASHGSGFDRASTFAHGYRSGPSGCVDAAGQAPAPLRDTGPAVDPSRAIDVLVPALITALDEFWTDVGIGQQVSATLTSATGPPTICQGAGPTREVTACSSGLVIDDVDRLPQLWAEHGDLAAGFALILDYTRSRLVADPVALSAADCYAGAVLARLAGTWDGQVPLTPADLDEAMTGLIADQPTDPRLAQATTPPVLERVSDLRTGFDQGPAACRR